MNTERDADTWDGGEVIDGMIVRGDLTIADMTEEEIAAFGPEAQAVLREQAAAKLAGAPKRRMSSAVLPALLGMAIVADSLPVGVQHGSPMSREDRERRHADRMSRREGKTARAEAKRKRKADRRLTLEKAAVATPSGEVPSSVTSINND